jgi:hypothetical protein
LTIAIIFTTVARDQIFATVAIKFLPPSRSDFCNRFLPRSRSNFCHRRDQIFATIFIAVGVCCRHVLFFAVVAIHACDFLPSSHPTFHRHHFLSISSCLIFCPCVQFFSIIGFDFSPSSHWNFCHCHHHRVGILPLSVITARRHHGSSVRLRFAILAHLVNPLRHLGSSIRCAILARESIAPSWLVNPFAVT